jgi:hypothetical protein
MKRYDLTDTAPECSYHERKELVEDADGEWVKYADVVELIRKIDLALHVPSAEYIPAISDVFTIIDGEKFPRIPWNGYDPGYQVEPGR